MEWNTGTTFYYVAAVFCPPFQSDEQKLLFDYLVDSEQLDLLLVMPTVQ